MLWKLRKLFELVKNKGKSLKEVYAMIPGSQEVYSQEIRKALKESPPSEFGAHRYVWLESCVGPAPEKIYVEVEKTEGLCYFEVDVSISAAGDVEFTGAREVEFTLIVQERNEAQRFQESLLTPGPEPRQFNEQLAMQYQLRESDGVTYVSVDFAGQADVRNRNGRVYTAECLQEAIEELQSRLPLPFCTVHEDQTDIMKTAGLIREVTFNPDTGTVTIPQIEILDTEAGRTLQELLDKGVEVEISHRAVGHGYTDVDESTGQETEVITWLWYEGFDTVWPGRSGFGNTHVVQLGEGATANPGSNPNNGGGSPSGPGTSVRRNQQSTGEQITESRIAEIVAQTVQGVVSPFQEQFQQQLQAQTAQQNKALLRTIAEETIEEILTAYPQFGEVEKMEIRRVGTDIEKLYERVSSNPTDRTAIKTAQERLIESTVETFSKMHASYRLNELNIPEGRSGSRYINNYGGVTSVDEVIAHSPLDATEVNRVVSEAVKIAFKGNKTLLEQSERNQQHENFRIHAQMLDQHMYTAAPKIQREIERGLKWETVQADVDVPVSITSMYVELAAWKMLTAIPHVQLHPMTALLENIGIQRFESAFGRDAGLDKWFQTSNVGEHKPRPTSKIVYGNYVLAASPQKYATTYTQESLATVRGTPLDITTEVVALCGKDIADLIDGMLWELMVNEALAQSTTPVSTAETLTQVGSTKVWKAKKAGWVTYEWVVVKNTDGNPTRSYPQRLFPDDDAATQSATTTRQKLHVTLDANGADSTTGMKYKTHWDYNAADGTIILTDAGETQRGSANVQLTYLYSNNCTVWDATVPSGMSFKDHLWDLRFAISDARQRVITNNYTPTTLAWSFAEEDKIAGGENFSRDGLSNVDIVNAQNTVTSFVGMDPVWSANFPRGFALTFEDMFALYGIHTPYMMSQPQYIDETGDPFLHGTQFSGAGIPKKEKAAVVAMQNLPYAV